MTTKADFLSAQGTGQTWRDALEALLPGLQGANDQHRLGMIYMTPQFATHAAEIEAALGQATGVPHWVGTVGYGTIGTDPATGDFAENFGTPSLS